MNSICSGLSWLLHISFWGHFPFLSLFIIIIIIIILIIIILIVVIIGNLI